MKKGSGNTLTGMIHQTPASASNQNGLSAYKGGSNTQLLSKSGNAEDSAVSQRYAQQKDNSSGAESSKSYESIHREIAGALGVAESEPVVNETYAELVVAQHDKQESDRLAANQQIIDDAIANGRRIDQTIKIGDQDATRFTEFLPSSTEDLKDAVLRTGTELTDHGFLGDTTHRFTNYFDSRGTKLGAVESVIKGGQEKITSVNEYVNGSIETQTRRYAHGTGSQIDFSRQDTFDLGSATRWPLWHYEP